MINTRKNSSYVNTYTSSRGHARRPPTADKAIYLYCTQLEEHLQPFFQPKKNALFIHTISAIMKYYSNKFTTMCADDIKH